jgi:hypothetical protein
VGYRSRLVGPECCTAELSYLPRSAMRSACHPKTGR